MLHNCQYLCSELVTVTYEDQPGEILQTIANLEEISATGAVVLLEERPTVGSTISLSIKGRDLFGVIQGRLHDAILGWYTVVTFNAATLWNRDWMSPKHLVAVCECSLKNAMGSKGEALEPTRNTEEEVPVNFALSEA